MTRFTTLWRSDSVVSYKKLACRIPDSVSVHPLLSFSQLLVMSTFWTAPLIALLSGTLLISLSLAYAISIMKWRARARGHHLPPGPRRFPFVGILPFTDGRDIWKIQQELCATYGTSKPFCDNSPYQLLTDRPSIW